MRFSFPTLSLALAALLLPFTLATVAPASLHVGPRHVINKVPRSFEGRWVHGRYRMLPRGQKLEATKAELRPRQAAPSVKPTVNSMFGVIQVAGPGGIGFISPALNGAGQFTTAPRGNALPIQLPSTSPSGIFSIFSSITGSYIGASVDSAKPLSNIGSGFRLAKRQQPVESAEFDSKRLVKRQQPTPAAQAVADAIQAAADAAYFAIVAAQDSAAILIFQAAEAATGPIPSAPSLAAAMTAANANYAQAYTRCVAYNAAKTKASNILIAGAPGADPSLPALFAAQEIATAARAAPIGGDPLCQSLTGGYQTATTAAGLIAFLTPAIVPAAPVLPEVVLTAIAYAAAIVPTGAGNSATTDGSIWTITPSSNPGDPQSLSAVYQNSDGGIVSPITFFQVVGSNFVGLTGDLTAYNLYNPTAPGVEVLLSFLSS